MLSPSLLAFWVVANVPLPGTTTVSVTMQPPEDCVACHAQFDGSPYDAWAGSTMGHAVRDPLYLAALDEAEKDLPGAGDFCLRCHAPEAWVMGRCFPTNGGRLRADDSGVTCSSCHRMDPSPWQRNGQFKLGEDLDYRGPYDDAQAPHHWKQSDFISDSKLCGTCHDLRNPLVMRKALDGTDTRQPFPEQLTYTEWATSDYALGPNPQSCQDCHMPKSAGQVARQGPMRAERGDHGIAGGNVFLKSAVAFLYPELGLSAQLDEGIAKSRQILRQAATVQWVPPAEPVGRGRAVELTFKITNLTGHKLPTGYPEGRRMWLQVQADALGVDAGGFDEARQAPVQPVGLWHTVQGHSETGPGYRLVLNDTIFFDNRIPPKGFVVTATTAPVGQIYPEVSPGVLAHWDEVSVTGTVACDAPDGEVRVDAWLWYQSVTKRYVDGLVADGQGSVRAQLLAAAFEEVDPGPLEMVRLSVTLEVDADSTCGAPDAGVLDSGQADVPVPDGGAVPDAGASQSDAGAGPVDEGGCTCSGSPQSGRGLFGLALICLWAVLRRRYSRTFNS